MLVPLAVTDEVIGVRVDAAALAAASTTLIELPLLVVTRPSLIVRETLPLALVRVTSGVATPSTKSTEAGETVPAPVLAESVAGPA